LAQLDAARRALNEGASLSDAEERARRFDEIADQLDAEAVAQQETGSAEAARQLCAAAASTRNAASAAAEGRDLVAVPSSSVASGAGASPGSGTAGHSGDQPGKGTGSGKTIHIAQSSGSSPLETAVVSAAGAEAALAGRRAS